MLKADRILLVAAVSLFVGILFSFSEGDISPRLQKKIDAAILSTFEVGTGVLKNIAIPADWNTKTAADFTENSLFEIYSDSNFLGYLYLGVAPSMKKKFDFIVLFNIDFTIKKSKVLIYREEHGKQIGSQRWLKQFIGLSLEDSPIYGVDIDAISGATISASSMTKAVGDVLKGIQILKENEVIK
ncbi:FMN-binding protein [Maribacter algarum]|uniref:FMN-binding protein n=1 Tax=Maribacter algarum (ex Zhang et al. 2020) TaxID=2578118 RepID=A0A5S3PGK4_9FLAO|nr:FMN-binding protein [Maribacter algarum]TMM53235.1 FMN-binding protein [Maribacter algarum]